MPSISEVLKTTKGFPRMRALSAQELLSVTCRLVQAEEVERLLEMVEGYDAPKVPKYIAPPKPSKIRGRAAMVKTTGEKVLPVGRPPAKIEYVLVDTLEQAHAVACRTMK